MHAVLEDRDFHKRAQLISSQPIGFIFNEARRIGDKAAREIGDAFRHSAMCGFYSAVVEAFVRRRMEQENNSLPDGWFVELEYEGAVIQVTVETYEDGQHEVTGFFIEGRHDIGAMLSDRVMDDLSSLALDQIEKTGLIQGRVKYPVPKFLLTDEEALRVERERAGVAA